MHAGKNLASPINAVELTVAEADLPVRLDAFLARRMPWRSRSFFCQMIDKGEVHVNGASARAARRLGVNDFVALNVAAYQQPYAPPVGVDLSVIHEDDDLLVLNKPPGIVVHPTGVHLYDTLLNVLHARYADAAYLPRPVHRLDRETGGVLVCVKNDAARTHVARQIEARRIVKTYRALVHGVVAARAGEIMLPLGTSRHSHIRLKQDVVFDGGLPAHTAYEVMASAPVVQGFLDGLSLLAVRILTGRTHQIRVHMAALGHPVLADKLYGRENACTVGPIPVAHHLLHAHSFACLHPRTDTPVEFTAPLSPSFAACVRYVWQEGLQ
jgi:23S rRNA pseudouridine1911/1915/1917 synthase